MSLGLSKFIDYTPLQLLIGYMYVCMQLAKFKGANAFCLFRCVWSCLVLLARPFRGGSFVSPVKGLSKRWRCWHSSQAKRSQAKPSSLQTRIETRQLLSVGSRLCWVDWLPSVFLTVSSGLGLRQQRRDATRRQLEAKSFAVPLICLIICSDNGSAWIYAVETIAIQIQQTIVVDAWHEHVTKQARHESDNDDRGKVDYSMLASYAIYHQCILVWLLLCISLRRSFIDCFVVFDFVAVSIMLPCSHL